MAVQGLVGNAEFLAQDPDDGFGLPHSGLGQPDLAGSHLEGGTALASPSLGRRQSRSTHPQILVQGFPADAELPSEHRLLLARQNFRPELVGLVLGEGRLPALLGTPGLGNREAFPLALQDH